MTQWTGQLREVVQVSLGEFDFVAAMDGRRQPGGREDCPFPCRSGRLSRFPWAPLSQLISYRPFTITLLRQESAPTCNRQRASPIHQVRLRTCTGHNTTTTTTTKTSDDVRPHAAAADALVPQHQI